LSAPPENHGRCVFEYFIYIRTHETDERLGVYLLVCWEIEQQVGFDERFGIGVEVGDFFAPVAGEVAASGRGYVG
jgi:hypothetical protein